MNTTKTFLRTAGLRFEILTLDILNSKKYYALNSKFRSARVQVFHPYGMIYYMCETVTILIKSVQVNTMLTTAACTNLPSPGHYLNPRSSVK